MKPFSCKQCSKKITKWSKSGLCRSCVKKGQIAWNKGKPWSEEVKLKLRLSHLNPSAETRRKISEGGMGNKNALGNRFMLGRKHTDEAKAKMSDAQLGNKHCLGRKMSEEQKKKLSKIRMGMRPTDEVRKRLSEIHKTKIGSLSSNWKGGKPKCLDCPVILSSRRRKRCHSCAGKKRSGVNSYNWMGGLVCKKYPKVFNNKLKLKIRERDNFTCQLCGKTEKQQLSEINHVLSVNHIDFNKENCDENNLNTLCCSCNSKINNKRKYYTEYFQQFQTCSP